MTDPAPPEFPIGFKEWARVCDLLAAGSTSLILRKGGIAEGRGGFDFAHDSFWLFPTFFHLENQSLKPGFQGAPADSPPPDESERLTVSVTARVEIVHSVLLTSWDAVARLDPYHPWEEWVTRERFEYKAAGLKAALVRVFKLPAPFEFPYEKAKHGGCRSWVNLPPDLTVLHQKALPVLSDAEHAARAAEIRAVIGNHEP